MQQAEGVAKGGVDVVRNVVQVRRHPHDFACVSVQELRLTALPLAERMQFAEEELAAGAQYARGFRKNRVQILDMLQHEGADGKIDGSVGEVPGESDVLLGKAHMGRTHIGAGQSEHTGRKVEGMHTAALMAAANPRQAAV